MTRMHCPMPVPSGVAYRVVSPPHYAVVTPALSRELTRVLERFAREAGFNAERPVAIGFEPGTAGHHKVDRAADIYSIGGLRLDKWRARWDAALKRARERSMPEERRAILAEEKRTNLGWRLYRAIQCYGRWSQPYGWPVQLFGPWTRDYGPWRYISDRLLHAHRDHIHVAK